MAGSFGSNKLVTVAIEVIVVVFLAGILVPIMTDVVSEANITGLAGTLFTFLPTIITLLIGIGVIRRALDQL